MTSSRDQALSTVLQDLDRCEHGRHRGDTCAGYSQTRPHAGCLGGISLGNPFLTPGRPIGYNQSGEPYIFPIEPFTTAEPKAWMPTADYALDVYLEMRHQVEPVLTLPTRQNLANGKSEKDEVQAIVDAYGWAVIPSQSTEDTSFIITVGMSSRGLPEIALYDVSNLRTAVPMLNAVACAHAQTVAGLAEGCQIRVGSDLVVVAGIDPAYGHRWHPVIGELYGEDVQVIGAIA